MEILDFIYEQLPGIFVGITVSLILVFSKKIINFFKNIPKLIYRKNMEKTIKTTFCIANNEIGMPLLPEVKLKIVGYDRNPEEIENKLIIFAKKEKKPLVFSNIINKVLDSSFLRDTRRQVNSHLYNSTKFVMGKSLITRDISSDVLNNFEREAMRYYERIMEDLFNNEKTINSVKKQETILKRRLFKTVLLQELYALGERRLGKIPNNNCKNESLDFVNFLFDIARKDEYEKQYQTEPPLTFIRNFFKCGVVLVKRRTQIDLSQHLVAIKRKIEEGAISIYTLGWGIHSKSIKKDIKKWLDQISKRDFNQEWKVEKIIDLKLPKHHISGKETPGVCCIFRHESWIP